MSALGSVVLGRRSEEAKCQLAWEDERELPREVASALWL